MKMQLIVGFSKTARRELNPPSPDLIARCSSYRPNFEVSRDQVVGDYGANRPFPSCFEPRYENEVKWKAFHMKITFGCI